MDNLCNDCSRDQPNPNDLTCAGCSGNEAPPELCPTRIKTAQKLNGIATIVNAALLTTTMRMNPGPEVFVSGSRFIEAQSLENILRKIAKMLGEE